MKYLLASLLLLPVVGFSAEQHVSVFGYTESGSCHNQCDGVGVGYGSVFGERLLLSVDVATYTDLATWKGPSASAMIGWGFGDASVFVGADLSELNVSHDSGPGYTTAKDEDYAVGLSVTAAYKGAFISASRFDETLTMSRSQVDGSGAVIPGTAASYDADITVDKIVAGYRVKF